MDAETEDRSLATIASAIADPARAIMLCALLDGCARTATELAAIANIGASTASAHFSRLREQGLVGMHAQGRHRYFRLANAQVAHALEALLLLTHRQPPTFKPSTPTALKHARTCYDHCAGEISIKVHDALLVEGWIEPNGTDYSLNAHGQQRLASMGIDVGAVQGLRRRLAYPCMDWSERSPHLGGALGAALLDLMIKQQWMTRHLDSRALTVTKKGTAKLEKLFGIKGQ